MLRGFRFIPDNTRIPFVRFQYWAYALIWGVVVSTYSSVCVAAPMIIHLKIRRELPETATIGPAGLSGGSPAGAGS
jgi:hypothetical protein